MTMKIMETARKIPLVWIRCLKTVAALALFTVGGLVYVVFRSDRLVMFSWFEWLGLTDSVISLRESYGSMSLYSWVVYNMPAGLWLFSYMFIIDAIWEDSANRRYRLFVFYLPVVAILSEFLQLVNLMPGTFDILDLASYIFAVALFLTIKILNK